ncbi:hypothetical protein AMTRI_Chr08g163720 [Amborella trichopoda]
MPKLVVRKSREKIKRGNDFLKRIGANISNQVTIQILVVLSIEYVCMAKCVSRLLNELLSSLYFARVHFLFAPSHHSNYVTLISIYSGWFFLSISSLTYVKPQRLGLVKPLVGEHLLKHPIGSNNVVCYKAYPNHATMVVYNHATNKHVANFKILMQNLDFGHSRYFIFSYATGFSKSVANPFQLTYEEKFIEFDMFDFDMISKEWVRITLPSNSCDTCFHKLIKLGGRQRLRKWEKLIDLHIEKRSRFLRGELKMERLSILPYHQQSLFIIRAMNASIEVAIYDIGSKRCEFNRKFFWHPRVHDLACPRISSFAPILLCCK